MNSLLGLKKGMTQVFDATGNMVPVTVVEAGPCVVTQVKTMERDGYGAVQCGFGKARKLTKPQTGHLKDLNARHLREFRVEKTEEYNVGQEIRCEIFKAGDLVAVSGISIGKGFAGTIKRHHHHRGPMSHGSKSHRIPGSIGAGTTPGRVYKGRKMSGRMGAERVTVKNLKVISVDAERNLLLLGGAVPGKPGSIVEIRKAGS
jgi:large subunit ribosomal protein L3